MNKTHRYFSALLAACLSLGLVLFVTVGTASAHASVIASTPKANSTIATVPATIQVTTAENMTTDPRQTNLFVYGPKGDLISNGNAKVDINNPMHMAVAIKTTEGKGTYIVHWITVSADDKDPDEGAFSFTVNPNATTAPTTNTTASSSTAASTSSSSVLPAVIAGIIALLVGLGVGFGIGRARPAAAASVASNASTTQESKETTTTPRT